MTPGQIIALIRDIAIVAGIGLILWLVYRGGGNSVKAADLAALQAEVRAQGQILDHWHQESNNANATLTADLAKINAAAAIPTRPVWVCSQPSQRKSVLSPTAREAVDRDSPAGAALSGVGSDRLRDIGPQLKEFEQRWETILAECRAEHDQWPE